MSMLGRRAFGLLVSAGLFAACAVAINDEPLISEHSDGGLGDSAAGYGAAGSGGSSGSSGSSGNGGWGGIIGGPPLGGSDGSGGDAGTSSGAGGTGSTECSATQKRCGGQCVDPGPTVGCTLNDCTPCPALWNAKSGCGEGACTITCNSGYVKEGDLCVAPGSGGTTGSGGSSGGSSGSSGSSGAGGRSGSCVASSCPGCSVIGPFPCCVGNRCGCTWAPGGYCL